MQDGPGACVRKNAWIRAGGLPTFLPGPADGRNADTILIAAFTVIFDEAGEQPRSSGMEASARDGTQARPVALPGDACLPDGTEALCRFTRGIKKRRPRLGTP